MLTSLGSQAYSEIPFVFVTCKHVITRVNADIIRGTCKIIAGIILIIFKTKSNFTVFPYYVVSENVQFLLKYDNCA